MELIQETTHYLIMIGLLIIAFIAVIAIAGIYFLKFYKKKEGGRDVDYDAFIRKDATDFMKFDTISNNMIVMGNRFVGGIRCSGVDYQYAEDDEKLQIMRGYLSFFNLIDRNNIQLRQDARNVNLDELVGEYQIKLKKQKEEQFVRTLDYEELRKEAGNIEKHMNDYEQYYEKLKHMQKEITTYGYQIKQLEEQINYMAFLSGDNSEPDRNISYFFDWTYNPIEFSKDLRKEEIYEKANRQLNNMAQSYISALRHAGVKAHRMKDVELMEEIRYFTHPLSSEVLQMRDIVGSNYDAGIVTSRSLDEMEEKVNKGTLSEILQELNQL